MGGDGANVRAAARGTDMGVVASIVEWLSRMIAVDTSGCANLEASWFLFALSQSDQLTVSGVAKPRVALSPSTSVVTMRTFSVCEVCVTVLMLRDATLTMQCRDLF